MGRSRAVAAVALLASLAVAGCGKHESKDDFLENVRAATVFDPQVRDAARAELVRMAPIRLPDFVALLEDRDGRVADVGGYVLIRVDIKPEVSRLRELAKGSNRVAAFWAARVLAPLDPIDDLLLERMTQGLETGSLEMRDEALAVLAMFVPKGSSPRPPRIVDALAKTLRDEATSGYAAIVLSRYGEASVPVLVAALDDLMASLWAIGALGTIGPPAHDAIPALERAMERPWNDGGLRRAKAIEALRRIRGE